MTTRQQQQHAEAAAERDRQRQIAEQFAEAVGATFGRLDGAAVDRPVLPEDEQRQMTPSERALWHMLND